jgi:hypothetical protein
MKKLCALMMLLVPAFAYADEPRFEYQKSDAKPPHWDVQGKAGLLVSGGNSQSVSASASLSAAHTWDSNRFLIEGGLAYVRTTITVVNDANGNGTIDGPNEIDSIAQATSKAANLKARYDRFFGGADQNSGFISGRVASDPPAGKQILGGGQLGYSRLLFKSDRFETTGELGYDFTYEKDEDAPPVIVPGVSIHSLRGFVQETVRFPPQFGASAKVEVLGNMNAETAPNEDGSDTVGSFKDIRVNGNVTFTATVSSKVSIALGFTARYDMAPSLRPALGIPYAATYRPFADKVDTLTELSVVVNFL